MKYFEEYGTKSVLTKGIREAQKAVKKATKKQIATERNVMKALKHITKAVKLFPQISGKDFYNKIRASIRDLDGCNVHKLIIINYIPKSNMKLYLRCKNCFSMVKVYGYYKYGHFEFLRTLRSKELDIHCHSCKKKCEYTTRDIRAGQDPILLLFFALITLIISVILLIYMINNFWGKSFYSFFAIPSSFIIPWAIYFTFVKTEQISIDEFNNTVS